MAKKTVLVSDRSGKEIEEGAPKSGSPSTMHARACALLAPAELDRLDPHLLRQHRLVLPNLADHRLGRVALEKNSTTFSV
jgi:hypothetical protein